MSAARPHCLVADAGHAAKLIRLGFPDEAGRILAAHAGPVAAAALALLADRRLSEAAAHLTAFADAYALA